MSTPKSFGTLLKSCTLSAIVLFNLIFSAVFVFALTMQVIKPKEKMMEASGKNQTPLANPIITIVQIQ